MVRDLSLPYDAATPTQHTVVAPQSSSDIGCLVQFTIQSSKAALTASPLTIVRVEICASGQCDEGVKKRKTSSLPSLRALCDRFWCPSQTNDVRCHECQIRQTTKVRIPQPSRRPPPSSAGIHRHHVHAPRIRLPIYRPIPLLPHGMARMAPSMHGNRSHPRCLPL